MAKTNARKRDTYHVGNLAPQLLEAARQMLEEVGPTKLSLRAVSERVGVSSTAAYHHFSQRSELIGHLAAQGFRELGHALRQRGDSRTQRDTLRTGVLAYFSFARRNPALYQLMFGPELAGEAMVHELKVQREAAFEELKRIIAEVLGRDLNEPEVMSSALAIWSYTHGLAALVIHGVLHAPTGMSNERLVEKTLQGFDQLIQVGGLGRSA